MMMISMISMVMFRICVISMVIVMKLLITVVDFVKLHLSPDASFSWRSLMVDFEL